MTDQSKEKIVYFVRHGETLCNHTRIVQGSDDVLSETGQHQANILASRLENLDFTNLIASSYTRALQTAKPIAEATQVEITPSDLFVEVRRPSEFIGGSRDADGYVQFSQDESDNCNNLEWRHSDEENIADVLDRAEQAVAQLEDISGDVVVVSHGRFLKYLIQYLTAQKTFHPEYWKAARKNFFSNNTAITTFSYKAGEWKLITFNDHAHFAE